MKTIQRFAILFATSRISHAQIAATTASPSMSPLAAAAATVTPTTITTVSESPTSISASPSMSSTATDSPTSSLPATTMVPTPGATVETTVAASASAIPTMLPTMAASPSTTTIDANNTIDTTSPCSQLQVGDVFLTLMNSQDPNSMAFFTLANVPTSVNTLYVTDQAWNGSAFMGNGEATLAYSIPASSVGIDGETFEGIGVGALFSYGFETEDDARWSVVDGNASDTLFNLNLAGDTVLVYCLKTDGTPHFLSGFSYAPSGWVDAGLAAEEYGGVDSALPDELAVNGSVAVPYFQNNIFIGDSSSATTKEELMQTYQQASNYKGTNDATYELPILTSGSRAGEGWLFMAAAVAIFGFLCV
ncbi:hypothetical protein MPSEU_001005600 [Mayamaea pseudoterrestris]|nr:hypothetical protein MPSEU_001005600 [Mayamaea pseudoterrestris]